MKNDTIVVTGGAGFIGSALIWALNGLGEDLIHVVDSLGSSEKWKNLAPLRFADYQEKDDFIADLIAGRFEGKIKTVFHLGACSSTTEKDIRYLVKNNVEYSRDLAVYCLERGIRFIYASSAATYGDGAAGYEDDSSAIRDLCPLNGYAFSKQLFDLWALNNNLFDTIVGLKYFNVFGPNEYHKGEMRSMVCKGYEQIRDTGKIRLFMSYRDGYRDGGQQRDFIYVKDAVKMTLFFYRNPDTSGLYNVGSGTASAWNTLSEHLFAAMGVKPDISYIAMPDRLKDTYQYYTRADLTRIRRAGYTEPITPIGEAIRDYVQNYLVGSKHLSS